MKKKTRGGFSAIASLLVVATFFFALSVTVLPACITSVTTAQVGAEEISTAAASWEDAREVLRDFMVSALRKELISEVDYVKMEKALDSAEDLASFTRSTEHLTIEIDLEKLYRLDYFTVLSGILKWTFSTEKMNLYITLDDESILNLSVNITSAERAELKTGELSDPTINVYTTEDTLRGILDSPDPPAALQTALNNGDITYKGVGLLNKGKVLVTKQASYVYGFFSRAFAF